MSLQPHLAARAAGGNHSIEQRCHCWLDMAQPTCASWTMFMLFQTIADRGRQAQDAQSMQITVPSIDHAQCRWRMQALAFKVLLSLQGTVMKTQWFVIANASSARIFSRDTATAPLIPVTILTHDKSRLHGSALESDRPGSHANDNSHGPNHFTLRTDARRKEHQRFAKEIAQRLDAGLKDGEFNALILFASNPFMGELTSQLSDAVSQRLKATLHNDLTHVGLAELDGRISGSWFVEL